MVKILTAQLLIIQTCNTLQLRRISASVQLDILQINRVIFLTKTRFTSLNLL